VNPRWLLGGAAAAALAAATWFAGDLLALGGWRPLELPAHRAWLGAAIVAGWIAGEAWRARRNRKRNERLLDLIAGGDASDAAARGAREVEVLQRKFEEAAAILKKTRFKAADGAERYVHELPWYMFIGAPGSGKTTALVNSGLRFPLAEEGGGRSLAGVGGTRNCDWWFTDEAVLLDTAGRYTTQESDREADAAAWRGFLDLLKRFRPRRPLNGALVTLSVSDLLQWNEEERLRYAHHVRARVAELRERLGVRFPLYLLVTKADLMAGFMEFFGDLGVDERARVWGTTFALGEHGSGTAAPPAAFAQEFAALEQRLYGEMVQRLPLESDPQRRAAMYRFPQQFHGLGPSIGGFVDEAFGDSGAAPRPLLRGVYFTSGTQEGNPIDRVLGSLERSFGLERAVRPLAQGSGRSFFLMRLMREVIFPEAGLAGSDVRLERRLQQVRALAYAAVAVLTAGLLILWTQDYLGHKTFVAQAQEKTAAAAQAARALGADPSVEAARTIAVLNLLRDLPGGYSDRGGAEQAGSAGLGLSQTAKIGSQAVRAYRNALQDALLPRLAQTLEDELRAAIRASTGREALASALTAYVGLYESPAQAQLPAAAASRAWKLPEAQGADLQAHLRAGLEAIAPEMRPRQDEAIIRDARQKLALQKAS